MYRPFLALGLLAAVGIGIVACGHKSTTVESDGDVRDLGYALFEVKVPKHQSLVVSVEVKDGLDGESYLLLADDRAPLNVGWFDATNRPSQSCTQGDLRARSALRSECQLGGEGFLVDERKVEPGRLVLQHGADDAVQCDDGDNDCTYYYAIVAAPRIDSQRPVHIVAESGSDEGVVHDPSIKQLQ